MYLFGAAILPLDIVTFSCSPTIRHSGATAQDSLLQSRYNSMESAMWKHYVSNPDSSEQLLLQMLAFTDSAGMAEANIFSHMHLAELYQYRKPDIAKALQHLSECMSYFIKSPGSYYENPYLYIDIGNLFYHSGFTEQSIPLYRIAEQIGTESGNMQALALALQNIGLMHQAAHQPDSALWYYQKAKKVINDTTDIKLAYGYLYSAELYLGKKNFGQAFRLAKKCGEIVHYHKQINQKKLTHTPDRYDLAFNGLEASVARILFVTYLVSGKADSSNWYFNKAEALSKIYNSPDLLQKLWFRRLYFTPVEKVNTGLVASSEEPLFGKKAKADLRLLKVLSDSLQHHFERAGKPILAAHYRERFNFYNDSLIRLRGLNEIAQTSMLLSSSVLYRNLHQMRKDQQHKAVTIKVQRIVLAVIFILFLVILLLLLLLLRQKRNLQLAHEALVSRIRATIELHANEKQAVNETEGDSQKPHNDLKERLIYLMQDEKVYLNKSLTLVKLAQLMNSNQTYVSNLINHEYNQSFNDSINRFRIDEACRLISDPANSQLRFDKIAGLSGFKAKSTFYAAFRKHTGMSPVVFKENISNALKH